MKKRIMVGISGASGAPIAVEVLKILREIPEAETHLVISKNAELTIPSETGMTVSEVKALADVCYENDSIGEAPASGSFQMEGMIVAPCSMKTLAGIAGGYSDSLLLRAADVTIKEGRKLILAARETPLSPIHLRNMLELSRIGVVIMPPVIEFYSKTNTVEEQSRIFACRLVSKFFPETLAYEWGGMSRE